MLLNLILFIVILGVIVLVHEGGHFLFAKLCGIYVHEFSIGMGPKLFSRMGKNKETMYSIRAIPIGGYCSLAGEGGEEDEKIPKDRFLQSKPAWQRFLVMFFGAGFNFLFAILLLFLLAAIWGAPSTEPVFTTVEAGLPAAEAGLETGDRVRKVNGDKVKTSDDLSIFIQLADKDKPIVFEVEKANGKTEKIKVTPIKETIDGNDVYKIGVGIGGEVKRGFLATIEYTFTKTGSLFRQMFYTLKGLFTGGIGVNQLSGPVGIYSIVGNTAKSGVENVFYLIALLSINVGVINLIPFPAFDGGRILFLLIEKIKGSPVKPETENKIHTIGFLLLMALMIYITFNDILKLF